MTIYKYRLDIFCNRNDTLFNAHFFSSFSIPIKKITTPDTMKQIKNEKQTVRKVKPNPFVTYLQIQNDNKKTMRERRTTETKYSL